MRPVKDREIKQIAFETLKHIKELCDAEDIRYFLGYGTALGAVRHKGFIPWDDDVDVYMLRTDFERYVAADKRTGGRYRLVCTENEAGYTLPLPKVVDTQTVLHQTDQVEAFDLGVYVDVFVLDAVPANDSDRIALYHRLDRIQREWEAAQYAPTTSTHPVKRMGKWFLNALGPRRFSVRIDKVAKAVDSNGETGYVSPSTYCVYGRERETYPLEWFGGNRTQEFCGMEFTVPDRVEDYLTRLYDDYMQLPPIEQRKSHHCFEAFWKENAHE